MPLAEKENSSTRTLTNWRKPLSHRERRFQFSGNVYMSCPFITLIILLYFRIHYAPLRVMMSKGSRLFLSFRISVTEIEKLHFDCVFMYVCAVQRQRGSL